MMQNVFIGVVDHIDSGIYGKYTMNARDLENWSIREVEIAGVI